MKPVIAVLGAGTMGAGIAAWAAESGHGIRLYDPSDEALRLARERYAVLDDRVYFAPSPEDAVHGADLVIEAAPESLEAKAELFARIAGTLGPETIVASNTSTYSLSMLSEISPFPDRLVIAHFFNPARSLPLVELVEGQRTRPGAADRLEAWLAAGGKAPVRLRKDIPGFIANRLQAALLREALHLLAEGVADAEQIDAAVTQGIGLRWAAYGPFEVADRGGLDIWAKVAGHLFPLLHNAADAEPLDALARAGKLGAKSGEGFYRYVASPQCEAESFEDSIRKLTNARG